MKSIRILSPAKINLTLDVLSKRGDGYHEIISIVQPVSLFDELIIDLKRGRGIEIESRGIEIPRGEENIAYRAAHTFLRESKLTCGIKIYIYKRIPVGAGLGGGSSNAAAVLTGLNRITHTFTPDSLIATSSKLGADVPLFIHCKNCIMEGIGEKITLLRDFPMYHYLLINPGFGISTKKNIRPMG